MAPSDGDERRASCVELEIDVATDKRGTSVISFRLTEFARNIEQRVDDLEPIDLENDPADVGLPETAIALGQALGRALFGQAQAREILGSARARANVKNVPLRLKLYASRAANDLQAIQWETLIMPDDDRRVAVNTNTPLSRYVICRSYPPQVASPPARLRFIHFIASPSDLGRFSRGEISARILGPIQSTKDIDAETFVGATLESIRSELGRPFEIVCLTCHGAIHDDQVKFCLVGPDGRSAWTPGDLLAEALLGASPPPRLVILMCCHSASVPPPPLAESAPDIGQGATRASTSFAVSLTEKGIPAVLAMQDVVNQDTARVMVQKLLATLATDGQIDRAVAAARAMIVDRHDWWVPSLFIHTTSGNIWDGDVVQSGILHTATRASGHRVLESVRPGQAKIWLPTAASLSIWTMGFLDIYPVHPLISLFAFLWALIGLGVVYLSYATPEHRERVARHLKNLGDQLQRASALVVIEGARADITWFYGGPTYSKRALKRTALIAAMGILLAHVAVISVYGFDRWYHRLSSYFSNVEMEGWIHVNSAYPALRSFLDLVLIFILMPAVLNVISDIISLVCTRAVLNRLVRPSPGVSPQDPPVRHVGIGLLVDFVIFALLAFMPVLLPYMLGNIYFVITAPRLYPDMTVWESIFWNIDYVFGAGTSWHSDTLFALCIGSAFTGCIPSLFLWIALWFALLAKFRGGLLFRIAGWLLIKFGEERHNPLSSVYLMTSIILWMALTALQGAMT